MPAGDLLIQQRSAKKRVGPNQWDLSVAEHLSVGETFKQGVQRGLHEELGIADAVVTGPLGPMHKRRLEVSADFVDYEFVESYRMDGFEGEACEHMRAVWWFRANVLVCCSRIVFLLSLGRFLCQRFNVS